MWKDHFQSKGDVVFRAPMSVAEKPQWEFAKNTSPAQDKIMVLFEFDERLSKEAACVSCEDHLISASSDEDEWMFGPFTFARVDEVNSTSTDPHTGRVMKNSSGGDIPHVKLFGVFRFLPKGPSTGKQPTASLLNAGVLFMRLLHDEGQRLGSMYETLKRIVEEAEQSLELAPKLHLELSRSRMEVLGFAALSASLCALGIGAGVVTANPVVTVAASVLTASSLPPAICEGKTAGQAELVLQETQSMDGCTGEVMCERVAGRLAKLISSDAQHLKVTTPEVAKEEFRKLKEEVGADPLQPFKNYPSALQESETGDELRCGGMLKTLSSIMVRNNFVGSVIDAGDFQHLYAKPFPFQHQPDPLTTFLKVSEDVWTSCADLLDSDEYAKMSKSQRRQCHCNRTFALVDLLRIQLTVTRVMCVLGAPDAGKSTFLEKAFGIKTRGAGMEKEACTDIVTMYEHPWYNSFYCRAYVADVPGFGDSIEQRNDLVRDFLVMIRILGPALSLVWLHAADRDVKQPSDELFEAVSSRVTMVVVTHLDTYLEKRLVSMYARHRDELERMKSEEQGAVDEKRLHLELELMREVKTEVEQKIMRLHDKVGKSPNICWAAFSDSSWLCESKNSSDEWMSAEPPKKMKTDVESVRKFFGIMPIESIRKLMDTEMDF